MTEKVQKPAEVFLFPEVGGDEKGTLHLSLACDDPNDIRVPVQTEELEFLQGMYALAPDKFRRLMNVLIDAAYQHGLKHGTTEAEADDVILMRSRM